LKAVAPIRELGQIVTAFNLDDPMFGVAPSYTDIANPSDIRANNRDLGAHV
jgi:hypothetical protein